MNVSGVIFLAPKEPVLTSNQFERLSNILDNVGNVFLAVIVLSPLMSGVDKSNWPVIVVGSIVTGFCWFMSVSFAKRGT